ncbi:MAG: tetratricopeptide repeat protein [Pedobacter sp.]
MELEVGNYNLGADAFKQKRYEESVWYYTQAIKDNPFLSFSQAYLWRGISFYFRNDFENSIKDLNEANLAIQNELRIHNWRGLSYKQLGKYAEAIIDLKKAIEIEPKFREAYIELLN